MKKARIVIYIVLAVSAGITAALFIGSIILTCIDLMKSDR